jgi:hypothetical protein
MTLKAGLTEVSRSNFYFKQLFIIFVIIYLNWKWFLPGGSGTTIRHNTQIKHITQSNALHTINTIQIQSQLQQIQLQLQLNN